MSDQTWDIALSKRPNGKGFQILPIFPMALSAALIEKGMFRAVLELTEEGILLKPYEGESSHRSGGTVELPNWNKP